MTFYIPYFMSYFTVKLKNSICIFDAEKCQAVLDAGYSVIWEARRQEFLPANRPGVVRHLAWKNRLMSLKNCPSSTLMGLQKIYSRESNRVRRMKMASTFNISHSSPVFDFFNAAANISCSQMVRWNNFNDPDRVNLSAINQLERHCGRLMVTAAMLKAAGLSAGASGQVGAGIKAEVA